MNEKRLTAIRLIFAILVALSTTCVSLASEAADLLDKDDIIVLDGSLQASVTGEGYYLDKLYEKGIQKNIIIAGLAKSSRLFTDKGNSIVGLLNELGPDEAWYYHPVAKITNEKHKAEMFFLICPSW